MKLISYFLAFVFLMYSIVSFIYIDPNSGKAQPTIETSVKGVLYLGMTLILAYVISTN
jgi:hypothetical protein